MDEILACWDKYARTMTPAADDMSLRALRDHSEAMLRAVALDIDTPQTDAEQLEKSHGIDDEAEAVTSAASEHGHLRQASNFTLVQLSSEFRALRASVLRLWLAQVETVTPAVLDDVIRFNEAVDQALAESIVTYAERAAHSRDLFDAILGHDLRGPLTAITMAGDMVARGGMAPDRAVELGRRITSSARFMSNMVDDMLEFARTRVGQAPMPVERVMADIEPICSGAIHDAAAMHPACEFEMHLEGQPRACIDADRIRQLLMNLLGNAGQHGARGRPIQLFALVDDDATTLRVVNEGSDIPAESLRTIFEPLVRLNAAGDDASQRTTSLGLGLHIARQIAIAHGGSIDVQSEGGVTTFTVHLPA